MQWVGYGVRFVVLLQYAEMVMLKRGPREQMLQNFTPQTARSDCKTTD
jgi:hypothetical protein